MRIKAERINEGLNVRKWRRVQIREINKIKLCLHFKMQDLGG
jgi:hypothetical protein